MPKKNTSSKAKRWTIQGLLVASAAGLGVAGLQTHLDQGNPVEAAQDEEQAATDPWVYDRTQGIRQELALTNADLASMGLGLDESKSVLTGLKTWVEQNRERLEAKDRAVYQTRRRLQLAHRSVRAGPRDEEVVRRLPGLEQALTDASASLKELYEGVGRSIEGQFSGDQWSAWQTAQANLADGVPHRYRFAPNLTETQRERIRAAVSKRDRDPTQSRFADADLELSSFQNQVVVAARSNRASNIEAVLQAEEEALPQPVGHQE